MKRVIANWIERDESPEEFEVDMFLENDNKYSPALDLFRGESYYLKMIDKEYEITGKNGTTLMRIDNKDNETFIDKTPLVDIVLRYKELTNEHSDRKKYLELSYEDKKMMRVGVSILMFFMRVHQDKEIIVSDNKKESSSKPSRYIYNPKKPIIISNTVYDKNEPQGREYQKQADNWLVRSHYRVRNGVKYLIKGYKKKFLDM